MKTKLITSLRTAANAIESGTFNYNWRYASRCNCGVVACTLLNKSAAEMSAFLNQHQKDKDISTWKQRIGTYCPVTGVPKDEVFKALLSFGLTQKDIVELEYLSNPEVLKRLTETKTVGWFKKRTVTKPRELSYDDPKDLVVYLRAWADLLVEQERGEHCTETETELICEVRNI